MVDLCAKLERPHTSWVGMPKHTQNAIAGKCKSDRVISQWTGKITFPAGNSLLRGTTSYNKREKESEPINFCPFVDFNT